MSNSMPKTRQQLEITCTFFLVLLTLPACTTAPPVAQPKEYAVELCTPLEFVNFTVSGKVTKAGASRLMEEKIVVGSSEPDAYEFLTTDQYNTNRIRVETGEQYLTAMKLGAVAYTTFDMTMQGWFIEPVGTLKFIEQAQPAQQSFLPPNLLPELSVRLLGWNDSDQEAQLNRDMALGKTIKDYAESGKVEQLEIHPHHIRFAAGGKNHWVEELARGDYDGDGVEDALIFSGWNYQEGSGRGYELYLVLKLTVGRCCVVRPFQL